MATPTALPTSFAPADVLTAANMNLLRGAFRTLQVVAVSSITQVSTTSTSYVTSGLSTSITPSSSSSKILIQVTFPYKLDPSSIIGFATLFRGTVAGTNLAAGSDTAFVNLLAVSAGETRGSMTASFLDSPATTSATTYTVGIKVNSAGPTLMACPGGMTGTLVLQEISA